MGAFSLLICLVDANRFVLLNFFTLLQRQFGPPENWAKPLPKNAKSPLPLDARRSKTSLLKLDSFTFSSVFKEAIAILWRVHEF